jgi:hypothetical protein
VWSGDHTNINHYGDSNYNIHSDVDEHGNTAEDYRDRDANEYGNTDRAYRNRDEHGNTNCTHRDRDANEYGNTGCDKYRYTNRHTYSNSSRLTANRVKPD